MKKENILFPLEKETLNCFYGPPGSGKSTICFEYLIQTVNKKKKVYFIDTEGGFSTTRLNQMDEDLDLKEIVIFKPKTFEDQHKIFEKLLTQTTNKNNIGLIIVDSLVMLYRLKLGEKAPKINQQLAEQLRILRELSINLQIPIIVTNQMYKDFDTKKSKMIGGSILEYWCKMIIELECEDDKRKMILNKHRHNKTKIETNFKIENQGLVEKKRFNLFD